MEIERSTRRDDMMEIGICKKGRLLKMEIERRYVYIMLLCIHQVRKGGS